MPFGTLLDTATVADHLDDPSWVVVDCRLNLQEPGWGAREYTTSHVPGAVFVDVDSELAGTKTGKNGRHPLPPVDALVPTFGSLGIAAGVQVVAYDQEAGMYASRLWWLLRWLGHDAVAVMDGGFARWVAEGRPTACGPELRAARTFTGTPRPEMVVDAAGVAAMLDGDEGRLVDARAPERYRGDVEPIDRVGGHIPGALSHFFRRNVDEQGRFLPVESLKARWAQTLRGTPPGRVVCYCGSGITAAHNLLALEHAGLPGARLYPGSWSEWSSDASRPIEKG